MKDLTPLLEAVISLATAIITLFVIPYLKSKYDTNQLAIAKTWVSIAVKTAEMIFTGTGKGKEKKQYVIDFLSDNNMYLDESQIDALIESSVLDLKKGFE